MSREARQFGTFAGVFTPTLLTILGVIMYLRLGWVVGNAGLLGSWLVILVACSITLATGLSLSSIATNTRLQAGGPYAIISRSLGREVGGSVGVPLFLSQALAVSMYVFGFREGWAWLYPEHPPILVDLAVFFLIFAIAYISADLAFKVQYLIMVVIAISLVSIVASPTVLADPQPLYLWGDFQGSGISSSGFWAIFAVFFPAATGIMAGANMSGELKNPRVSIPLGTLSAIGVSTVVFMGLAYWLSIAAPPEVLRTDYTIMIDLAAFGPIVLAGLLGATFSSGLTSLVGAPRILAALGQDGVLPRGDWVATLAPNGEPRRALQVTGAIVLAGLLLRDLNAIAPMITMFFLIAYAVINVVMLVEASLGLMSFRPTFRLPIIVPLVGALGSGFAMFIVNPVFGLVSVGFVLFLYAWLTKVGSRRETQDDVRSGVFAAVAEWAAAKVMELHIMSNVRAWKPNFLVPVQDPSQLRGEFRLLIDLGKPEGSIKLLGLATRQTVDEMTPRLANMVSSFQKHRVFTTGSVIDSADYQTGIVAGLQALGSAFFRPNVLGMRLPEQADAAGSTDFPSIIGECRRLGVAAMVLGMHAKAGLGREKILNLWIRPQLEGQVPFQDRFNLGNANLAVLLALRLTRSWQAELNLISMVDEQASSEAAAAYLDELRDLCRIPALAKSLILFGDLDTCLRAAPQSDLDFFGMPPEPDIDFMRSVVQATRSSCLFCDDSGHESALA